MVLLPYDDVEASIDKIDQVLIEENEVDSWLGRSSAGSQEPLPDEDFKAMNSTASVESPNTPHRRTMAAAAQIAAELELETHRDELHLDELNVSLLFKKSRAFVKASCYNSEACLVDQPWFNAFICFMVLFNAINMGLEVDFDLGLYGVFCSHMFTTIWTVEFLLKIWFYGARKYFKQGLNVLDFLLACLSVVDVWLMPLVASSGSGLKNLSVLRLLRLIRLVRLVKVMRAFGELWLLINGLMKALAVLVWVILLLLILIYMGAIFLSHTIGGECEKPEYLEDFEECFMLYGTLLRSMLTLFQVVTDGYMDVARPVFEKKPWMIIFFVGFVYLTSFGLMNIVAGVIFEQVLESAAENNEKEAHEKAEKQKHELDLVRKVLVAADTGGKGCISPEEWLAVCECEAVQKIFTDLGFSVSRKRLAQRLYEVADADRTQNVELDAMLSRIFQLKTEGMLQNQDMTLMLMDIRHQGRRLDRMEDKLSQVFEIVTDLQCHLKPGQHQIPNGHAQCTHHTHHRHGDSNGDSSKITETVEDNATSLHSALEGMAKNTKVCEGPSQVQSEPSTTDRSFQTPRPQENLRSPGRSHEPVGNSHEHSQLRSPRISHEPAGNSHEHSQVQSPRGSHDPAGNSHERSQVQSPRGSHEPAGNSHERSQVGSHRSPHEPSLETAHDDSAVRSNSHEHPQSPRNRAIFGTYAKQTSSMRGIPSNFKRDMSFLSQDSAQLRAQLEFFPISPVMKEGHIASSGEGGHRPKTHSIM